MGMLAAMTNTSVATVSRAINGSGYVHSETKKLIISLAKKHKYQVNRSAKNLRKKNKISVGIVIDAYRRITSEVTNPFLFQLLNVTSVELELLAVETVLFNLVDQSEEYFYKLKQRVL